MQNIVSTTEIYKRKAKRERKNSITICRRKRRKAEKVKTINNVGAHFTTGP